MGKKHFKILLFLCLAVFVCACLPSCRDEQSQTMGEVRDMVSALSKNDVDTLYSYMNKSVITQSELEKSYGSMYEMLGGVKICSFKNSSYEVTKSDGVTSMRAEYVLTTLGGEVYEIQVRKLDGYEGYVAFVIRPLITHDSDNLSPAYEQAGIILYTLACLSFCVLMAIDCVRRLYKENRKRCVLWFILIFCGISLRLVFALGTISFLPYPSSVLIPSGIFSVAKAGRLILHVPVGGIVYFVIRKRLTKKHTAYSVDGKDT